MKKSKDLAIATFVLGMFSIVPLLNIVLAPLTIYFGIKSLIKINKEPDTYAGIGLTVAGLAIAGGIILFSLIGLGMCLYGAKEICKNMGLTYFT